MGNNRNTIERIKERELNLFGHMCIMEDNRLLKEVVFGDMEKKTTTRRPCKGWLCDIKEWRKEEIHVHCRMHPVNTQWSFGSKLRTCRLPHSYLL